MTIVCTDDVIDSCNITDVVLIIKSLPTIALSKIWRSDVQCNGAFVERSVYNRQTDVASSSVISSEYNVQITNIKIICTSCSGRKVSDNFRLSACKWAVSRLLSSDNQQQFLSTVFQQTSSGATYVTNWAPSISLYLHHSLSVLWDATRQCLTLRGYLAYHIPTTYNVIYASILLEFVRIPFAVMQLPVNSAKVFFSGQNVRWHWNNPVYL